MPATGIPAQGVPAPTDLTMPNQQPMPELGVQMNSMIQPPFHQIMTQIPTTVTGASVTMAKEAEALPREVEPTKSGLPMEKESDKVFSYYGQGAPDQAL